MKKIVFSSISIAMMSAGPVQAASTGTITFNGQLNSNTCDVVVDGQAADATVVLPTIGTNLLSTTGQTAGDTGFTMALNNCAGTLETASAFFEAGATVDSVTRRLNNTGTATNVSLQLLDGYSPSRAVIEAGNQSQVNGNTYVNISSGSANLPYIVRYFAEGATTAGTVVSNVVYSVSVIVRGRGNSLPIFLQEYRMKFPSFNLQRMCLLATALFSMTGQASVVISGTRVIYPADANEVSVKINNGGPSPVLLQSWIDNSDVDAKPSAIKVPFVLTPPMNRVESGKGQTLRITYTGDTLPSDRESVFWLNVLEVPVKSQAKSE